MLDVHLFPDPHYPIDMTLRQVMFAKSGKVVSRPRWTYHSGTDYPSRTFLEAHTSAARALMLISRLFGQDVALTIYPNMLLDTGHLKDFCEIFRTLTPFTTGLLRRLRLSMSTKTRTTVSGYEPLRQALVQCTALQDLYLTRCRTSGFELEGTKTWNEGILGAILIMSNACPQLVYRYYIRTSMFVDKAGKRDSLVNIHFSSSSCRSDGEVWFDLRKEW